MSRKIRRTRTPPRPDFSVSQILAWADAHHRRLGTWPTSLSGPIRGALNETWRRVDSALRLGLRGLPGGSSLARLLDEQRGVRNLKNLPRLTVAQLLCWADAFQQRTGAWPVETSGPIDGTRGESWHAIDRTLRVGLRGLPAGSSLVQLLARHRGVRNLRALPHLSLRQILAWADAHRQRTGQWPTNSSGPIPEAPGEGWKAVDTALHLGRRGLPGGSSLARLLAQRRGVRNTKQLPRLTLQQIRAWARAHRRRTGQWPTRDSGPVAEAPEETWSAVAAALLMGCRGLPAGMTLAGLLSRHQAVRKAERLPPLSVPQILAWADAHHRRTGTWPHARSGPIIGVPGETWRAVDEALRQQRRGLKGRWTLARLLCKQRGLRTNPYLPRLKEKQIWSWARAHYQRTGAWPNRKSGPVDGIPGETWLGVDEALQHGVRGLAGGSSLARWLARQGGIRNRTNLPSLQLKQILVWAKAHYQRSGAWPTSESGPIEDAPGETWKGVDQALFGGYRGMRGGLSLARLLAQTLKVRNRTNLPPLTCSQIRRWAEAHRRRTGAWPTRNSGPIQEAPDETWNGVELALYWGYRGLKGGISLARLLHQPRK